MSLNAFTSSLKLFSQIPTKIYQIAKAPIVYPFLNFFKKFLPFPLLLPPLYPS